MTILEEANFHSPALAHVFPFDIVAMIEHTF